MIMVKIKRLAFLALGLSAVVFSCNPEKEDLVEKAPSINLEVSGNIEKLHNEVTLASTVNGDASISSIEFYLNEEYLGGAIEAPYEFLWDTKNVEDGTYTLKAIAYNASSNTAEATQEVTIKNTLMKASNDFGYILNNGNMKEEEWIFLSDNQGNIVGEPQQVINGISMEWQRPPDFNSDTIYLNLLRHFKWESLTRPETTISLITYPNFPLDDIKLKHLENSHPLDKVEITIENDFDKTKSYSYFSSIPGHFIHKMNWSNPITFSLGLREKKQKVLSQFEYDLYLNFDNEYKSQRKRYYRWDELEIGNAYYFHVNEYTAMEGNEFFVPFNYKNMQVKTTGYLNKEDQFGYLIDDLLLFENEISTPKIFYVDGFSDLYTTISGSSKNKSFQTYFQGKAPETFDLPEFYASVNKDDQKNIQATTRGNFDGGSACWSHVIDNESEYYYINREVYFSTQPDVIAKLPDIPESLLELYPELSHQLEYEYAYMIDFKNLDSYQDLMKLWFTEAFTGAEYREYSSLKVHAENTGGRMLTKQTEKDLKERIEKENLRARGLLRH